MPAETPSELRAYPPALRGQLAALELQHECGAISAQDFADTEAALLDAAKTALGLDGSWNAGPYPLWRPDNPNGTQSVFWRLA